MSRVDVLVVMDELIDFEERHAEYEPRQNHEAREARAAHAELQAAAHAVLTASDLTDVLAAHDRLAAALAACGTVTAPDSDTNNHEAIHGICAQGEIDEQ